MDSICINSLGLEAILRDEVLQILQNRESHIEIYNGLTDLPIMPPNNQVDDNADNMNLYNTLIELVNFGQMVDEVGQNVNNFYDANDLNNDESQQMHLILRQCVENVVSREMIKLILTEMIVRSNRLIELCNALNNGLQLHHNHRDVFEINRNKFIFLIRTLCYLHGYDNISQDNVNVLLDELRDNHYHILQYMQDDATSIVVQKKFEIPINKNYIYDMYDNMLGLDVCFFDKINNLYDDIINSFNMFFKRYTKIHVFLYNIDCFMYDKSRAIKHGKICLSCHPIKLCYLDSISTKNNQVKVCDSYCSLLSVFFHEGCHFLEHLYNLNGHAYSLVDLSKILNVNAKVFDKAVLSNKKEALNILGLKLAQNRICFSYFCENTLNVYKDNKYRISHAWSGLFLKFVKKFYKNELITMFNDKFNLIQKSENTLVCLNFNFG